MPSEENKYPRVLIIAANPLCKQHSNSLTMSSLFEGWPRDRIAQVFVPFATPVPPEFDVCDRYWVLRSRGLQNFERSDPDSNPFFMRNTKLQSLMFRLSQQRWASKMAYPIREWWYSRPALWRGHVMKEIEEYEPQIIFSNTGALYILRLQIWLGKRFNAPIIPLITDDWISTQFRVGMYESYFSRYLTGELHKVFYELLDTSTYRLVISDAMKEEYMRRYGRDYLTFTQCVDATRFNPTLPERSKEHTVRFIYAGNLILGRAEELKKIGKALLELSQEGYRCEFHIYSPGEQAKLYRLNLTMPPVVDMRGSVSNQELPLIYHEADVLIATESFLPEHMAYTKLSFSTKLSEYLMAGRPVFAFGPGSVSSIRFVGECGGGISVGEDDFQKLKEELRRIITNISLRARLGEKGRECALLRFEAKNQRERFRQLLEDSYFQHHQGSLTASESPALAGAEKI